MRLTPLFLILVLASCRQSPASPAYGGDWHELRRGELDGKWGYIDHSGKFVIEPRFENESNFSDGLAWVLPGKGAGYGYIDKTGALVIKPQFHFALDFKEGLAAVKDHTNKWGYVDTSGRVAIAFQFDDAQPFSEGLAPVRMGDSEKGLWGYIDKTGKFRIEPRYQHSQHFFYFKSYFSGGVAVVDVDRTFHLIDPSGNVIAKIEGAYDVHPFHEGRALVRFPHDAKCSSEVFRYFDATGKVAFPAAFCAANEFSDGLAAAYQDGKYGYIDTEGNFAIPPQFVIAQGFSEGLAAVKVDGHTKSWSFIDKTGRTVIPQIGDGRADAFRWGAAAVDLDSPNGYLAKGARWGYIDRTGRVIGTFIRSQSTTY